MLPVVAKNEGSKDWDKGGFWGDFAGEVEMPRGRPGRGMRIQGW